MCAHTCFDSGFGGFSLGLIGLVALGSVVEEGVMARIGSRENCATDRKSK